MSMKANELSSKDLMIEDWLQDSFGNIGQVYRLDPGRVHLRLLQERPQDEEYIVHDIEPIPLTPEILEKNGFEDTICDAIWISTNCNLLWKDGKLKNFCREEDDEVCIPCEYVHKLQHALKLCGIDKEIVI